MRWFAAQNGLEYAPLFSSMYPRRNSIVGTGWDLAQKRSSALRNEFDTEKWWLFLWWNSEARSWHSRGWLKSTYSVSVLEQPGICLETHLQLDWRARASVTQSLSRSLWLIVAVVLPVFCQELSESISLLPSSSTNLLTNLINEKRASVWLDQST